MLEVYNDIKQDILKNEPIKFTKTKIKVGCSATLENEDTISLNKPGIYAITFNMTADTILGGSASNLVVQLYNNGEPDDSALSGQYSTDIAQYASLGFTTLIKVAPSCCAIDNTAKIQIINNASDLLSVNSNLVVVKVC